MANKIDSKEAALKVLSSKKQVSQLGVEYTLKVTNVHDYTNPETGNRVFIVSLAAQTPYHRQQSIEALKEGKWEEAANPGLSANRRPGVDWTPIKGQLVNVVLDTFTTKDGEEAIGVASMTPLAKAEASAFDFSAFAAAEVVAGEAGKAKEKELV